MNNIIISNCCLGIEIHKKLNNCQYNNPFIGTLILDDFQYLNLCKNIKKYMNDNFHLTNNIIPSIYVEQTNHVRYIHPAVKNDYPILTNNEIDIHAIHNDYTNISKFYKRQSRFNKIIETEHYKIFCIMTYTNIYLKHNNYIEFINNFLNNNDNDSNIIFLFLGPELEGITHNHYIIARHMNKKIKRNLNNVNNQSNFTIESDIIVKYIKNFSN